MTDLMHVLGLRILHLYRSAWWQVDLTSVLLGFFSALALGIWSGNRLHSQRYSAITCLLLYASALANIIALTLTFAHHYSSPWTAVSFIADHSIGFFVVGAVVAALSVPLIDFSSKRQPCRRMLLERLMDSATIAAARYSVGTLFVAAGMLKFLALETLDFFHASGYSTGFFYFIAAWELGWGICVFFPRSETVALLALSIDMTGAIYTHYHNYFTKGFPGPFGNSTDALRMLKLMAFVALGRHWQPHLAKLRWPFSKEAADVRRKTVTGT